MSTKISLLSVRLETPRSEEKSEYDVVVVGGGAAGVTAAIYSVRYGFNTLLITETKGGQLIEAGYVENYPGFTSIMGAQLASHFYKHLEYYGVPVELDRVENVERVEDGRLRVTTMRRKYLAKAVILTVGVRKRKLRVPGEEEFAGRGVSYCAACDAPLFKGKVVAVVGGGDSAANAALLISEHASRVYLIHRRDQLRAEPIYVKRLKENPKIELVLNARVKEIRGEKTVKKVILDDGRTLDVDGVFVEIGADPPREFFKRLGLETDEEGYVKVNPDQSTNIPGVFAAGDCTTASMKFKQIATAVGEGAVAAWAAREYILRNFGSSRRSSPGTSTK